MTASTEVVALAAQARDEMTEARHAALVAAGWSEAAAAEGATSPELIGSREWAEAFDALALGDWKLPT